jgi:hypothetical protein
MKSLIYVVVGMSGGYAAIYALVFVDFLFRSLLVTNHGL